MKSMQEAHIPTWLDLRWLNKREKRVQAVAAELLPRILDERWQLVHSTTRLNAAIEGRLGSSQETNLVRLALVQSLFVSKTDMTVNQILAHMCWSDYETYVDEATNVAWIRELADRMRVQPIKDTIDSLFLYSNRMAPERMFALIQTCITPDRLSGCMQDCMYLLRSCEFKPSTHLSNNARMIKQNLLRDVLGSMRALVM